MLNKSFGTRQPDSFAKVRVGTIQSGTGLRAKLQAVGCGISSPAAEEMIDKITFCDTEQSLDLVVFLAEEYLDYYPDNIPTMDGIIRIARKQGLYLCPPEVGPQLCVQYINMPINGSYLIGMQPILAGASDPFVFKVYRNNQLQKLHLGFNATSQLRRGEMMFLFSRDQFQGSVR